jgi:hypothetical protein
VEITADCGISLYIECQQIEIIQTILSEINDIMFVKAKKIGSQIVPKGLKD